MHRYRCRNTAMVTTAAPAFVATGTTIKTMLQIATPSTRQCQLIAWGFDLDAPQAGTVELLQTDVAATVTAHVAAGIQPLDPNAPASLLIGGTTATGFTASGEGVVTTTRSWDTVRITGTTATAILSYNYQWMPDERPIVAVSRFLRVRVTFGSTTNMLCWVVWDE
jgi:hypothetical protein